MLGDESLLSLEKVFETFKTYCVPFSAARRLIPRRSCFFTTVARRSDLIDYLTIEVVRPVQGLSHALMFLLRPVQVAFGGGGGVGGGG